MARTKSVKSKGAYKWIAHIQHHFNDREREECIKWIDARESDMETVIDEIVQKIVSLKVTYSQAGDGYQVTLQPKDSQSPYWGYTIGVSHVNLLRAIRISQYVVAELLENEAIHLPETTKYAEW